MASEPDQELVQVLRTFKTAIEMLDSTEPGIRDLIESDLMNVAGISGSRVGSAQQAAIELTKKIAVIRTAAIKAAFRHLRDNLPQ